MRWAIFPVLAIAAAPAISCPPPPPGYHAPTPEEALRQRVRGATNIVYAVVDREIEEGGSPPVRAASGRLRVMHTYKGGWRMSQLIPMYGLTARTDCGNIDYSRSDARQGAYGIILLQAWNGRDPMPFVRFETQATVDEMLRLGLIESARGGR